MRDDGQVRPLLTQPLDLLLQPPLPRDFPPVAENYPARAAEMVRHERLTDVSNAGRLELLPKRV